MGEEIILSSLSEIIERISSLDEESMQAARARQNTLTKPQGSLGKLENLSVKLAGITGNPLPVIQHKAVIVMAGDHGVVAEGVTLYPQEVTAQMVHNFLRGGACINVLTRHIGARVVVVDVGVKAQLDSQPQLRSRKIGLGTKSIIRHAAMTRQEAIDCVEAGIDVVEEELGKGLDMLGAGEMGIGNTTASSAVCAAVTGVVVEKVTGRGTGVDDEQLTHKTAIVQKALDLHHPDPDDVLDVLSKVGGFEIGGIAGIILAGAAYRIPVVIDGFISGAGALIAAGLAPRAKEYIIAAHISAEPGHRAVLEYLGLQPLLDMGMRLGEGTGACLGMFFVEAAAKLLREMATFEEAEVSEAQET